VNKGNNDLEKVCFFSPDRQSSAEVYLFGAHLTSYVRHGKEVIFVSSKSHFKPPTAIRGGIPVIFPQFGPGKLQQHGFARNNLWAITDTQYTSAHVTVTLELKESAETLKVWNFPFKVSLRFLLSNDQLSIEFTVANTGTSAFDFTAALHTYFKVNSISKVKLSNLKGIQYIDKMNKNAQVMEENDPIIISQETDRAYQNAPDVIHLEDDIQSFVITKSKNLADFVVWNPWIERAKAITDFGDEEYESMICIEPANAVKSLTLNPNEHVVFQHTIKHTDKSSL